MASTSADPKNAAAPALDVNAGGASGSDDDNGAP
jgi:hypothetical protein